ncbi:uncharacterized protein LOC107407075 [Ziziphus jujuba]|uniref:Uncharacterized protein LOC107407075 n=1 Tax=Ziziphus jujuba TaxID=326968 RepID=A0A6P3Z6N8_ZIZJJ|nr:uncharacterized protein LOC107407075 [Ziziphus jujuba]
MATSPSPSRPPVLDVCTVFSETKRIINAHSRHFLALSVLFILPLSFSFVVFPTLQDLLIDPIPNNSQIFTALTDFVPQLELQDQPTVSAKTLFLALAYSVLTFVFSLCAIGSITYSVFHGFYGRPVKLVSAIKSIFFSFFPLLGTLIVAQIIVFAIAILFAIFLFLVITGIDFLGFETDLSSPYVLVLFVILMIVLISVLLYLQTIWNLAFVVVVLESSWGLQPLRRSGNLLKGMRRVAFSMMLFFVSFAAISLLASFSTVRVVGVSDGWKSWQFVVEIVGTSSFLTLVMLYNFAANTVLYMYCKAIQGELAFEIVEEFAREYVCLPFDDEKVPHVVSVVYT